MSAGCTALFGAGTSQLASNLRAQAFKAHYPHSRCIKFRRNSSIVRCTSEENDEGSKSEKSSNSYWETINTLNSILTEGRTDIEPDAGVKDERKIISHFIQGGD